MQEQWKQVPDWPKFWVSNQGRVKTIVQFPRTGTREMLRRPSILSDADYPLIQLDRRLQSGGYESRRFKLHRLVAMLFVPGEAPLKDVHHKNGNIHDFRAQNLEWVERKEHQYRTKLPFSKWNIFTESDKMLMKKCVEIGLSYSRIARAFDTYPGRVHTIVKRLNKRLLKNEPETNKNSQATA